ncbi:methyltransferase domain-containing protein [Pyrococcus kukulkanii]|uniref:Ubiquinone biosynthesis protein n=1 Tax=Pyrococcus kukulkanii TaxID=1609559 RepID=A0A127BCA9_9EURY|nr:class I SAM-dependent methyltransferase [Pyrococcus kukulkanii]AMM54897.1 ubiquinone biosynthesis protein [Pyrococcus kukulkanii]
MYREKYNRLGDRYEVLEIPLDRYFNPLRKKAVSLAQGRTLEVGVGTGKTLRYYPRDVELYAIDGSEEMIKIAKRRAKKLGLSVKFFVGDVEKLPFPDNFFDTVISSFVFCTVPNPRRGMEEIKRVLKPGGRAVFLEHTISDSQLLNVIFLKPLDRILGYLIDDSTLRRTHELIKEFFDVELEEKYYKGIVRLVVGRKG